jgi:hypothetical protein
MQRVNGWLTIFWIAMIPLSIATALDQQRREWYLRSPFGHSEKHAEGCITRRVAFRTLAELVIECEQEPDRSGAVLVGMLREADRRQPLREMQAPDGSGDLEGRCS